MGMPPDLGAARVESTLNAIYIGFKKGIPYIGKSFNILNRYNKAERAAMQVKSLVSGVKDPKLLRAVEQKVLEEQMKRGIIANKRNAFNPNRKDYKNTWLRLKNG